MRSIPGGSDGTSAVIGVSLKSYFDYRQTLDWCAEVAALPILATVPDRAGAEMMFVLPSFPGAVSKAVRSSLLQLAAALSAIPPTKRGTIIVAHEPVWAIGAQEPAPDGHIRQVCKAIGSYLNSSPVASGRSAVIYGDTAGPGQLYRLFARSKDYLSVGRRTTLWVGRAASRARFSAWTTSLLVRSGGKGRDGC